MDRRAFIAGTLSLPVAPQTVEPQRPSEVWRIGYLQAGIGRLPSGFYEILREGLRDLGYMEGRNLVIESPVRRRGDGGPGARVARAPAAERDVRQFTQFVRRSFMAATLQISGTAAEVYEQHMVPAIFARWAPDLVEASGVGTGERALDVACGTGAVTRLLAERVGSTGKVAGLDINPGMLAVARLVAPSQNIEWLESSAVKMPLPDASFDAVVCQQGLQFFPEKPAAVSEMRRVLKRGGRLALSCWRSVEHTPGYLALEQALARRIGPEKAALPPFSFGDAGAIRGLVAGAGFREVKLRAEAKMVRFQSAEHLVRSVVGGAPAMMGALTEQGEGVLDAIIAEVTEATRQLVDDEGWATPAVSHIVTAIA